jgi:hypothetical protein
VALFRKSSRNPAGTSTLQIPDQLAERAKLAYGSQDFEGAFTLYTEAIDKLHTMYVMGGCKYRRPSEDDLPILHGIVSALGAAKSVNGAFDPSQGVQQSCLYLEQIARKAGGSGVYEATLHDLCRASQ